jgi:hypothetical protein
MYLARNVRTGEGEPNLSLATICIGLQPTVPYQGSSLLELDGKLEPLAGCAWFGSLHLLDEVDRFLLGARLPALVLTNLGIVAVG